MRTYSNEAITLKKSLKQHPYWSFIPDKICETKWHVRTYIYVFYIRNAHILHRVEQYIEINSSWYQISLSITMKFLVRIKLSVEQYIWYLKNFYNIIRQNITSHVHSFKLVRTYVADTFTVSKWLFCHHTVRHYTVHYYHTVSYCTLCTLYTVLYCILLYFIILYRHHTVHYYDIEFVIA